MKRKLNSMQTIATAALVAFASMPAAYAADTLNAADTAAATAGPAGAVNARTRLIVQYRDGTAAATDPGAKLQVLDAAASRASLSPAPSARLTAAGRAAPVATSVARYVRKLGTGADLLAFQRALSASEGAALVSQLRADPSVAFAQVDTMKHISAVPNDQYFNVYQWNLKAGAGGIRATEAWDVSTGAGVIVAVIDTGVLQHPDLAANLLPGYDFITDAFVSRRETDERVPGAQDLGDWNPVAGECYDGSPTSSSSWHGTHVAGTVAELTNNGVGMAGIAYNAKVLPVRVLGRCGGYTSDIADAIVWASGGTVAGVPANANVAEVINMSLGGGGACDALTQQAINGAVSRGVTVVVAAGNQAGPVADHSPASCANVISVGATGVTGAAASYTNYGPLVDLSAPGGGGAIDGNPNGYVWQNLYNGATTPVSGTFSYNGFTGTSMASPHVAATVALIQSVVPTPLTPAAMEALLKSTVRPFGVANLPSKPIGSGILDAANALQVALHGPSTDGTAIFNNTAVAGVAGTGGSTKAYKLVVPAPANGATIGPIIFTTSGGTGDVNLSVKLGAAPTATVNDGRSARVGNNELVRVMAPVAGTYYIALDGVAAYSGVTLKAAYTVSTPL